MGSNFTASLSRRDFLIASGSAIGAAAAARAGGAVSRTSSPRALTFGIFADPHYAERPRWGGRYYSDSDEKLLRFVEAMAEAKPSFIIGLGDLIDQPDSAEAELRYLRKVAAICARFKGPRHFVIGNHDVVTQSKEQFIERTGMPRAYYSFDRAGFHFVVLDANFKKGFIPYDHGRFAWNDAWIPPAEQKWLAADLAAASGPTVVFVHQRLDDDSDPHTVRNAREVRKILESSGKVIAVFSGHDHRGGYRRIEGIHYVTLRAVVEGPGLENNSFALVRLDREGRIGIRGYAKQPSRSLEWRAEAEA